MDAAASLNPLTPQRPRHPVVRARTIVAAPGDHVRAEGRTAAVEVAPTNRHASTQPGPSDREQPGSYSSAAQLRREAYSYGAQLALRTYHATAHADVEVHRVDTYA